VKKSKTSHAIKVPARSRAARRVDKYVLRLYVAGATDRSRLAVQRAQHLCENELHGIYDLRVIDIYQQPIIARDGQILATPTLVREFPRPVRRLIGSLANMAGIFAGLDLDTKGKLQP
jgi:circadian clock protein KaiB